MDFLYGHERKLSDFEDPEMTDVLGPDLFSTSSMVSSRHFHMFDLRTVLSAQQMVKTFATLWIAFK